MVPMGLLTISTGIQAADRAIIFSSPQTNAAQPWISMSNSGSSLSGILPGTLQAPMQFSDFGPARELRPAPSLPVLSAQQQRMKSLLDDRKNWTLMTPEEILGAATMQKTLEAPEKDALGREIDQTQMERYLERGIALRDGPTNAVPNERSSRLWNFSHDPNAAMVRDSAPAQPAQAVQGWGQLFRNQPAQNQEQVQGRNFNWPTFSQPSPQTTKSELEQLAAMERFRQLLNPAPAGPTEPASDSQFFPVPKSPGSSIIMQPEFVPNPAGASYVPLSSGISKPTGLAPLPSATAASFAAPVTAPIGRVQPPPWLLQGPQPFVMPQAKY